MKKQMKGTQTGVLIMTALLILSFVMAVTMIPLNQGLAKEISDGYKDLSRISEAKTYGDMRHHNEGLSAAEYSINNQTIELAKNGGGLTWSNGNIPTQTEVAEKLETEANKHLYQNYAGTDSLDACTSPQINHTLETKPTQENSLRINVSTHRGQKSKRNPAEFICGYSETQINYTGEKPRYGEDFKETTTATKHHAEGNRYYKISKLTIEYYQKLKQEMNEIENSKFKGESSCGCDVSTSEKNSALNNANNKVEKALKPAKNSTDSYLNSRLPTWAKFSSEFDTGDTFSWSDASKSTDKYKGSLETSKLVCDTCCNYDDNGDCESKDVKAKAKIEIDNTSVNSSIKERDPSNEPLGNKILTEKGWENILFIVDSYVHNF